MQDFLHFVNIDLKNFILKQKESDNSVNILVNRGHRNNRKKRKESTTNQNGRRGNKKNPGRSSGIDRTFG